MLFDQDGIRIEDSGETSIELDESYRFLVIPLVSTGDPKTGEIQKLSQVGYAYHWPTGWKELWRLEDWEYHNLLAGWPEKGLDPDKIQRDSEKVQQKLRQARMPEELKAFSQKLMDLLAAAG